MADYGWRNDNRRQWDEERDRFPQDRSRYLRQDLRNDEHFLGDRFGENWNRWNQNDGQNRQQDFGRESDYGAGYSTPRSFGGDLNRRPGGMRDDDWRGSMRDDDWRGNARSGMGNRNNFADYRGNYGNYPSDYQDYGDWQGQGASMGDYGGPRFGSNYSRNPDMYGRGYGDYRGPQSRGFSPSGPDYGDSRETNRGFWSRASDEVASWMGDEDASRRRDMDRMQGSHSGRGPKGYVRSDERIREDVNDRLTDDWRLDASNIEVVVSVGEVTLSGTVGSRDDKHRAEHLVENLAGVKHVQNNLRVDTSQARPGAVDQSVSTPVGSSGSNTSIGNGQSRGSYASTGGTASAGTATSAPGSSSNANQTH